MVRRMGVEDAANPISDVAGPIFDGRGHGRSDLAGQWLILSSSLGAEEPDKQRH